MKSENNGKIAIAIVAMFVVALSIVGFTYAYFTTRVNGNTRDKSVEVTAGRLEVLYSQGQKIAAVNIVPGWISDGKHYYDPVYSGNEVGGVYQITSVTTDRYEDSNEDANYTCKDGSKVFYIKDCSDSGVKVPTATTTIGGETVGANGITDPVEILVTNTANNTGNNNYIIKLNVTTNTFGSTDRANVKVTVKNGTYDSVNETWSPNAVVWSGTLAAATNNQIIVPAAESLAANNANGNKYYIYLTYVNVQASQNDKTNDAMNSEGGQIVATANIMAVVSNDGGTTWVDSDGNSVTFAGYEADPANPGQNLSSFIDYTDYANHKNGI